MNAIDPDLLALEQAFLERVARDRAGLARHWQYLAVAGNLSAADPRLRVMSDIAHGLNGAGGTFGFPEISHAAERLESLIAVGPRQTEALAGAVETLLQVLDRAVSRRAGGAADAGPLD